MKSDSHREFHAKAAKKLAKLLRAGDPSAIERMRAVFHDTQGQSDDVVIAGAGLQRCQHVIATEAGFENWAALISAPAPGPTLAPVPGLLPLPPYVPSEDTFESVMMDFGLRFLHTARYDHVERAFRSIDLFFATKAVEPAVRAAARDASSLLMYRTTPQRIVNDEPRPKMPVLEREGLSVEERGVYSRLMGECALYLEREEKSSLSTIATSVAGVFAALRALPSTAEVGTTVPVQAPGFVHHDVKGTAGPMTVVGERRDQWTMSADGWYTRLVIHIEPARLKRIGGRSEVGPWLAKTLPCPVDLRYFDGEYAHVILVVPPRGGGMRFDAGASLDSGWHLD